MTIDILPSMTKCTGMCRSLLPSRIFFSNMSNLFKNNMKDGFCQEKKGASSFTEIDTNVQY